MTSINRYNSKTRFVIASVAWRSHNSSLYQEIATDASRPRNDVQVFCDSVNSTVRDSSLTLRMAGASDETQLQK
jgi:hypothetical protein